MNSRKLSIAFIGAALLVSATAADAQLKIGTVDINRVVKEYAKTKEAEAQINEAKSAAKKEFDERANAYKTALDELNKLGAQMEAPALAAEARATKAKERDEKVAALTAMQREINEFRITREQQLQQQVMRLRDAILKEVTDAVMARVKANNIDLVFDKSGLTHNGIPALLFARENTDFTAEVSAALQRSATPSPAQTPARSQP